MGRSVVGIAGVLAVLIGLVAPASGQDYGFDWVTVGDPGNRDTLPEEVPATDLQIGGVGYEFRVMRGKLSTLDYAEFVRAYAPFWDGRPYDIQLTGWFVGSYQDGQGQWQYEAIPGKEHFAASLSWEMAARYCNWLHNGKVNEAWAFEDGAYDTSTFYLDDDGFHHQATHHPGAKFWIPTLDEYAKAGYWDPAKNGGEGGYCLNPDGGDEPLYAALPEDGGETIGDILSDQGFPGEWDLGQYPHVQSPWGLIDISATLADWTEGFGNPNTGTRLLGGSMANDMLYFSRDQLNSWGHYPPTGLFASLRISSTIPGPAVLVVLVAAGGWCPDTRRRRE
jgi:hypothetical protein